MNNKKLFGRICSILMLIFLVQTRCMFAQGDINVVIPEVSLTNTALLLQDAKALNFAKINAVSGVPYFGMYTTSVEIDLKDDLGSPTSETIAISLGVTARAFFNLSGFRFDVVVPFSITVFGRVALQQHQGGYKLVANLQGVRNFNLTGTGWIDNYVQDLANGFIQHLPPISLVSETALLPNTIASYFTSGTPVLKITNDAAILSLTLSNLPRQVTARNNYDGNFNVGQVEVKEGSNFVAYNSPHTYFAPINSIQTLRANQGVTSHNSNQYKYKNWNQQITGREAFSIQSNPFSFQVTSDLVNTADFKQVVPATISNSLEGIATGGSLIVNGISYSSSFNDYLFKEGNGITTNVPNGTLGTDWSFQGWSNGMTTPQINFAPTSAATLIANGKGQRISNIPDLAGKSGGSRTVAIDATNSNDWYQVYESNNAIWLSYSTNAGASWQPEVKLGDGKNPSIASGGVVWVNGGINFRTVGFQNGNLNLGSIWSSNNHNGGQPASLFIDPIPDAHPCIAHKRESDGSWSYYIVYEHRIRQGFTTNYPNTELRLIRLGWTSSGFGVKSLHTIPNSFYTQSYLSLYPAIATDNSSNPNVNTPATIVWQNYVPTVSDGIKVCEANLVSGSLVFGAQHTAKGREANRSCQSQRWLV